MTKGEVFYDKNGVEIQEGDLLKVFHFVHYYRRKKMYMYHVAVLEEGYFGGRSYNATEAHYNLKVCADQHNILREHEIVCKPDYQNEVRLRREGAQRLQQLGMKNSTI
jgi:hypothetical protein